MDGGPVGCRSRDAILDVFERNLATGLRGEIEEMLSGVNRLVPFVHVDDVARSVAFYGHLGFVVKSVYEPHGRPVWAALESDGAELMVALDGDPDRYVLMVAQIEE